MSNFAPIFTTFEAMRNDPRAWALVDTDFFSVSHMTDEQIREAVIEDILTVTMFEKERKSSIDFTHAHLLHHLRDKCRRNNATLRRKVNEAYNHSDVQQLLQITGGQLRIREDMLDEAQDYCGVYFEISDIMCVIDNVAAESFEDDLNAVTKHIVDEFVKEEANASPIQSRDGNVITVKF